MSSKDEIITAVSAGITLIFAAIALLHSILAISVNSGRIDHLIALDAKIQNMVSQIAKNPTSPDVAELQTELTRQNNNRGGLRGIIQYGDDQFWSLPMQECVIPTTKNCFLKNASETNNLYLGSSSGVLGVCLVMFFTLRRRATGEIDPNKGIIVELCCMPGIGAITGMFTLFLVRGTKGWLLTPVSDVVQIENPYGISFICALAAFYSDRLVAFFASVTDRIFPTRTTRPVGRGGSEGETARADAPPLPTRTPPS